MHRPFVRRVAMPLIAGAVVVAAVASFAVGTRAQSKGAASPSTEWPTYGHDPGGARYSPLTDITPANVGRLSVAWVYHMKPADVDGTSGRRQIPRWRTLRLPAAAADAVGAAAEVRAFRRRNDAAGHWRRDVRVDAIRSCRGPRPNHR